MSGATATVIAILGTSLSNLPVWILTGLAPTIGVALGFGSVGLGSAISLFFAVAAVAALPAGTIVDRIGWRYGTVLSAALLAVSLGLMGLADGWMLLLTGLLLGAVGFAFSQPCANLALAETVTGTRQGTAFGAKQASLPLTTLVVGVALPLYLGPNGWRWAFVSSVGLTVVFLATVLYPGKRYEDWEVDDPADLDITQVRAIRDDIRDRVENLLTELGVPTTSPD